MNFDHLAPFYTLLERSLAGGLMQRARRAALGHIGPNDHVLLVGEGPGRFLECLRHTHPFVRVTCLDASAAMLALSQQRVARHPGGQNDIAWVHADATTWTGGGKCFDVVVTHFVFDCHPSATQERLVERLTALALPGARWLVAEFQPAPPGWRRMRSNVLFGLLYPFFRVTTGLPARRWEDPSSALASAGWNRTHHLEMDAGWVVADCWQRA